MATFEKIYNVDCDTADMADIKNVEDVKVSTEEVQKLIATGETKKLMRLLNVRCLTIHGIEDYMWFQEVLNLLPALPCIQTSPASTLDPMLYLAAKKIIGIREDYKVRHHLNRFAVFRDESGKCKVRTAIERRALMGSAYRMNSIVLQFPDEVKLEEINLRLITEKFILDGDTIPYAVDVVTLYEREDIKIEKEWDDSPHCHGHIDGNMYVIEFDKFWHFSRAGDHNRHIVVEFDITDLSQLPLEITSSYSTMHCGVELMELCLAINRKIKVRYSSGYMEVTKYDAGDVLRHDIVTYST